MTKLALGLGLGLGFAACSPGLRAPRRDRGDIPVRVLNDTGRAFCDFRMAELGEKRMGESWIPRTKPMPPGDILEVSVRAGAYRVSAQSCDNAYEAYEDLVEIEGPSELSLGGVDGGHPGMTRIRLHGRRLLVPS